MASRITELGFRITDLASRNVTETLFCDPERLSDNPERINYAGIVILRSFIKNMVLSVH